MTASLTPVGIGLIVFPLLVAGYQSAVRDSGFQPKSWLMHCRDVVYCATGGGMVFGGFEIIGKYGLHGTRAELSAFPISIVAFSIAAHFIDNYYFAKRKARIQNATNNINNLVSSKMTVDSAIPPPPFPPQADHTE
jgi:hypothetical protein